MLPLNISNDHLSEQLERALYPSPPASVGKPSRFAILKESISNFARNVFNNPAEAIRNPVAVILQRFDQSKVVTAISKEVKKEVESLIDQLKQPMSEQKFVELLKKMEACVATIKVANVSQNVPTGLKGDVKSIQKQGERLQAALVMCVKTTPNLAQASQLLKFIHDPEKQIAPARMLAIEKAKQRLTTDVSPTRTPPIIDSISGKGLYKPQKYPTNSFGDVIHNIGAKRVEMRLADISQAEVESMVEALGRGNFDDPIFANLERFPLIALKALQQDKITATTFATVTTYYAVREQGDFTTVKMFDAEGKVNPIAAEWLFASYDLQHNIKKVDAFFAEMKTKPLLEQQFWIIKIEARKPSEGTRKPSEGIWEAITNVSLVAPFTKSIEGKRVAASLGMYECNLKLNSQEQPVTLRYILGLGTHDDMIQDGLNGTKIVSIPLPGEEYPTVADGYPASKTGFIFHDAGYHALLASNIPMNDRKVLVMLALEMKRLQQQVSGIESLTETSQAVLETCIDMEITDYRIKSDYGEKMFAVALEKVLSQSIIKGSPEAKALVLKAIANVLPQLLDDAGYTTTTRDVVVGKFKEFCKKS